MKRLKQLYLPICILLLQANTIFSSYNTPLNLDEAGISKSVFLVMRAKNGSKIYVPTFPCDSEQDLRGKLYECRCGRKIYHKKRLIQNGDLLRTIATLPILPREKRTVTIKKFL